MTITDGKRRIVIDGLPQSEFMPGPPVRTKIPTSLEGHCACLSVGLRMPVSLHIRLRLD
ncbi:MAG: hypothetical protein AAF823_01460 [Planctomycetota bacterium]